MFSAASALPPFCSAPLGSAAGLCGFASASAGSSFGFVGSAPAYPPLSGTSATPSVLLSQCLVMVLLSLCSWFVAPVAPGVAAPVPEAFVPHLDCLRLRWCLTSISIGIW